MEWRQHVSVSEHELMMVRAMNMITDLPDWHRHASDDDAVAVWREKIETAYPHLSAKALEWCLRELKDKASDFLETGFVRVLDTGSVICKGDNLLSAKLVSSLKRSTSSLFETASWLASDAIEVDVVDPQKYPLIYDRTMVFQDGGITSLKDPFGTADASKAPSHPSRVPEYEREGVLRELRSGRTRYCSWDLHHDRRLEEVFYDDRACAYRTSSTFQCLPCDVEATDSGCGVRISSYINNLHPQHSSMYRNIEKLIAAAIAPWNSCLIRGVRLPQERRRNYIPSGRLHHGRIPTRIPSFGALWVNELPLLALSFNKDHPDKTRSRWPRLELWESDRYKGIAPAPEFLLQEHRKKAPPPTAKAWRWAESFLQKPDLYGNPDTPEVALPDDWQANVWALISKKALERSTWTCPWVTAYRMLDPGITMSYEDWRAGKYTDPLMAPVFTPSPAPWVSYEKEPSGPYYKGPVLQSYSVKLQNYLRRSGLQVIVKAGGIELTPQRSAHEAGEWQLQGFLNEHIVAIAFVAFDFDNISPCSLDFRQETSRPGEEYDSYWRNFHNDTTHNPSMARNPMLHIQHLGGIELRPGRLITFPNVMESRLSSFHLLDPTRKGHLRYICLHLVDPNYRICSTRNGPPQQHEWWAAEVVQILLELTALPVELCHLITGYCEDWPISHEQALRDKANLLEELELANCARYATMKDE